MNKQTIKLLADYYKFYFSKQKFIPLDKNLSIKTTNTVLLNQSSSNFTKQNNQHFEENRESVDNKTAKQVITNSEFLITKQKKINVESPSKEVSASEELTKESPREKIIKEDLTAENNFIDIKKAKSLDSLRAKIHQCQRCELCFGRKNIVYGQGNQNAQLLFIGEAPGAEEDQQGLPFVGKAGKLLNQMLLALAISREAIYITNIVKCRPAHNRNPEKKEMEKCSQILEQQIKLIQPKLIILLGSVAFQWLLPEYGGIMKNHGKEFKYTYQEKTTPVLATFHPAYLLRFPDNLALAWRDFKKIRQLIAKYCKNETSSNQ